jgi:ATP-dependent RNA helicase SUPV3L1/SUV3
LAAVHCTFALRVFLPPVAGPVRAWRPPPPRARPAPAVEGATSEQAAKPAAETPAEQKHEGAPHRGPRRDFGEKRADQQDRQPRQEGQRDNRNERGDRPPRRDRGSPIDRADRDRYFAKPGMRQSKEADPNSPFAKLAALKQQLEDNAKR